MKTLLHAAAFAVFALPAVAQDVTELATKYVNLPEVQNMMTQMFSADAMAAQFAASLPPTVNLTDSQREKVGALMSKEMNSMRPRLEQLMIEGSADVFSAAELEALIEFYSSEHGGSVMSKMQPFMTQTMGKLAPEMMALQQRIAPELIKIMQEPAE